MTESHLLSWEFSPSDSLTIKKMPPGCRVRYTSRKLSTGPGQKLYGFKCGRQIKRTIPKGEAGYISLQNLAAACLESLAVHTLGLFHGYF